MRFGDQDADGLHVEEKFTILVLLYRFLSPFLHEIGYIPPGVVVIEPLGLSQLELLRRLYKLFL